jgi:hypothetical protein
MHKTSEQNAKRFFEAYVNNNKSDFHRFPVDCWRLFPDSGNAFPNWSKRNSFNTEVVEPYTNGSIFPHNVLLNQKLW